MYKIDFAGHSWEPRWLKRRTHNLRRSHCEPDSQSVSWDRTHPRQPTVRGKSMLFELNLSLCLSTRVSLKIAICEHTYIIRATLTWKEDHKIFCSHLDLSLIKIWIWLNPSWWECKNEKRRRKSILSIAKMTDSNWPFIQTGKVKHGREEENMFQTKRFFLLSWIVCSTWIIWDNYSRVKYVVLL